MNRMIVQAWPAIFLGLVMAVVGVLTPRVSAQSFFGSIAGTVTDSTGAAVPGATVTVTNVGTNDKRSVQSGATGDFRLVNLLPAVYKVEVKAGSFKTYVREAVTVQVDNTVRVDTQLQVGGADETVTVTTQAPLLQTDSGSIGSQVEGQIVQEMPLNGRNAQNLIALVPGVVPQGSTSGAPGLNSNGHTVNTGWNNYQIGGGIAGYGAQYIDGSPVNVLGANAVAFIPTQDALQEFKVATNAVTAEFGRFGGGVVEMTTKSGGNRWHGSLYEYVRNTVLNANTFNNNAAGKGKTPFHQNQYGVTASGPIVKDKAFFFFSWENFNRTSKQASFTNVPTQTMRNGVFAKTLKGASRTITDPSGACTITYDAATQNYTIPTTCYDPTSKVMMGYYPLPNLTGNSSYNYVGYPVIGNDTREYVGRVDYNLSDRQRLFGRYGFWDLADVGTDMFNNANGFLTTYANAKVKTHAVALGDTYTLNASTILDLRASYLRSGYTNMGPGVGKTDLSQFGAAYAAMAPLVTYKSLPNLFFTGSNGLYKIRPMSGAQNDSFENFTLNPSLIKIWGAHTFKLGGEARLSRHVGIGNFPNSSSLANYSAGKTGDEYAAFLLGIFDNANIQVTVPSTTYNYSEAIYLTDVWQVNRKLTLNLGLRWELPGGVSEAKDRMSVLLPDAVDPVLGLKGGLVLTNSDLAKGRSANPVHYNFLDPRVSFAYRVHEGTAIRGGYGIVFLSPDLPSGMMAFNTVVASAVTTSTNPTGAPKYFQKNPFPTGIIQPAGRSNPNFAKSYLGQVVSGPVRTENYPYMQQWNLSLSQQWKGDVMLEAAYVGSKGTHLPMNGAYSSGNNIMGMNQLDAKYYSLGSALGGADPAGKYASLGQSLRPYPQFQDYQNSADYSGATTYHALQSTLTKRFASGGVLNANYTWAKMMSDTDSMNSAQLESSSGGIGNGGYIQNFNNKKLERSISSFDTRQRFIISYVAELPFGKGKKYANVGGPLGVAVSGWSLSGIVTAQSGFPLSVSQTANTLVKNYGAGTLRPNLIPGCKRVPDGSRFERYANKAWFNTACYTAAGNYELGNAPRVDGALHQQGIANLDFTVTKSTKIKEFADVQFRAEFFNIANHPQFATPGTQLSGTNWNIINNTANEPRELQLSLRLNF